MGPRRVERCIECRQRHGGSMDSKVALVTGGAQGLGAATAVALAGRGWSVVVADIDNAGAQCTVASCERVRPTASTSAEAFSIAVDLAVADGPQRMIDETLR